MNITKRNHLLGYSLSIIAILFSCNFKKAKDETLKENKKTYSEIKQLSWLVGKWEMDTHPGLTTETWSILNDSVFSGTSLTVGSGKDTIFFETITIEQRGKEVFYFPVIKEQHNGKPTLFKLTNAMDNRVVFENPGHDFPQKILYQLKGDSLIGEISGNVEGKIHSEKFPMVKVK